MKKIYDSFYRKYLFRKPARLLLVMYLVVISIGTLLLMLPISSSVGEITNPIDALFTTVSATCVTGLVTVTTATNWSFFGQLVIIFLIQLGGLGVMTAASIVALIFNKKVTISSRLNLSEEKNADTIEGIIRIVKFIIFSTFIIEIFGAIFLSFTFVKEFGFLRGVWASIFHSISAFCNAGFDIVGNDSLGIYVTNYNVSIVISLLIILGGIGHVVYTDLIKNKFHFKKYAVHTKLVLVMTSILLFIPMIFFLICEYNNPDTLKNLSFFEKILASFFQSTTLRTAGFYTIRQDLFVNASAILMLVLMFIGGSPAGTAGGFKTTSFASLFLITRANVKQEKDINVFKRRIPSGIKDKVISIFTISIAWIFIAMLIISITDPAFSTFDTFYEVISAYGTVGLTRGITSTLSIGGKIIIMLTMLFGKIGPLSIIVAFINKSEPRTYREKREEILIG